MQHVFIDATTKQSVTIAPSDQEMKKEPLDVQSSEDWQDVGEWTLPELRACTHTRESFTYDKVF